MRCFSYLANLALLLGVFSFPLKGEKNLTLSIESSTYLYEEPQVMTQTSQLTGFNISYLSYLDQLHFVKGELNFKEGMGAYQSNDQDTMSDDPLIFNELRLILIRNIERTPFGSLSLQIGLANRSLLNDSSGRLSSEGRLGYKRHSMLYYVPIAAHTAIDSSLGAVVFGVEFDYLLLGMQKNTINFDGAEKSQSITNRQNRGYGTRFTMGNTQSYRVFNLGIDVFLHTWNIDRSDEATITIAREDGADSYSVWEPQNQSLEWGIRANVIF